MLNISSFYNSAMLLKHSYDREGKGTISTMEMNCRVWQLGWGERMEGIEH